MVDAFDWARCNKSDGKFDAKKLAAINHEHLKQERLTSTKDYIAAVKPFLDKRGLSASAEAIAPALATIREKARTLVEAAEALDFFFRDPPTFDEKAVAKFLVADQAPTLDALVAVVESIEPWTLEGIEAAFAKHLEATAKQIKDVAQPARVALSGRTISPGIYETLHVLGKARSLERLRAGAAKARAS
jgi:glutamyl-tRNA synthetase